MLLEYNEKVQSVIKLLDFKGNEVKHNIKFPAAGSVGATGSKLHKEGFFSFTSFMYPGTKYAYNYETDEMTVWKQVEVKGFVADDYETKQVFYPSKDGTKVPMYIMSPKGMKLDGSNPTILYGYGGFDISLFPDFRVARMLWLNKYLQRAARKAHHRQIVEAVTGRLGRWIGRQSNQPRLSCL